MWPMAMPSSTPMVLNSKGTPPAASDGFADLPADDVEMGVARNDLDKGVAHRNKRLIEIGFILDPRRWRGAVNGGGREWRLS